MASSVATMTFSATTRATTAGIIERLNLGIEAGNQETAVIFVIVKRFVFDRNAADALENIAFDHDPESIEFAAFVAIRTERVECEIPLGTRTTQARDVNPDSVLRSFFGCPFQD